MTFTRLISVDTRSGFLVALGTTLLLAPVAIGLSAAAMVTGVLVGALAIGLGLAGTAVGGRGTIPVSAQMAYDQGLGVGLVLTAAVFIVAGDPTATLLFGVAGAVGLLIAGVTRYSAQLAH